MTNDTLYGIIAIVTLLVVFYLVLTALFKKGEVLLDKDATFGDKDKKTITTRIDAITSEKEANYTELILKLEMARSYYKLNYRDFINLYFAVIALFVTLKEIFEWEVITFIILFTIATIILLISCLILSRYPFKTYKANVDFAQKELYKKQLKLIKREIQLENKINDNAKIKLAKNNASPQISKKKNSK